MRPNQDRFTLKNKMPMFKIEVGYDFMLGKAGSVAVLPPRCGPLSPGSIPGPGAVCPFGFQHTCFRRFFSGYSGFPPESKTGLLSGLLFVSVCSEGPSGKQCLFTE